MRKTALQKAHTHILDLEAQLRDLREAQWALLAGRAQLQDRMHALEPQLKQALQDRDAARKRVAELQNDLDKCTANRSQWIQSAALAERRAEDANKAFDRLVRALREPNAN